MLIQIKGALDGGDNLVTSHCILFLIYNGECILEVYLLSIRRNKQKTRDRLTLQSQGCRLESCYKTKEKKKKRTIWQEQVITPGAASEEWPISTHHAPYHLLICPSSDAPKAFPSIYHLQHDLRTNLLTYMDKLH